MDSDGVTLAQEPNVDTLLDTASTAEVMVRLCRSLAFNLDSDICFENGPGVPPDSS